MRLSRDELRAAQGTRGSLDLARRGLTEVPSEIGQLTNLRSLDLDDNQLTEVPPEICQLTLLERLSLADNQLTVLPPEILDIAGLEMLWLSRNQLTRLPPEIDRLARLEALGLSGNQLTTLPPEIGRLANLQNLTITNAQLTKLPAEIGLLTHLQTLRLDGNRLTALPPEIGRLTNLRELSVSGNRLTNLPPEIGQLTSLRKLHVADNQLTTLPRQIAEIFGPSLQFNVDGNPLAEPFPELIQRGYEALVTYLRSLDDAVEQYQAKLLLLGEGNVGKTSLSAALISAPFIEGRPTTHGIEIQSLALRHPDRNADMTVRAWDFGGQEVYRVTHQFFFSRRAIYLVVWNAREGQEQNEVEGWLRRIRLRVNREARVLVVATHADERRPELDYPQLERSFPGLLAGKYEVDNRSGRGIAELRQAIASEAAQLPQMGQLVSPRWIAARDATLALASTEPQIPYDRFTSICQDHQVVGDEMATLAELMHDLGQIIYYGDDEGLRDFVVLNPEWLTKAISYVLEDEPTRQSGGILDHARLMQIWENRSGAQVYPARYHPYFLRLMEKFDVSYRLEDDPYRSLVAQLVPYDRPTLPWGTHIPAPDGIRSLSLVCQLSEPAPGLVAWLTVRHHRSSTGKHWRSGVFLRHPIKAYGSEALIELRAPDQLALHVRAPSPDFFFNVLRDSIEDLITRRWPGLAYQLLIPCPALNADGSNCQGVIPMTGLLAYREEGDTHYRCMQCRTKHDISVLLTGFTYSDGLLQSELDQMQKYLAEIASGVQRVEGYAADTAASVRRVLRVVGSEITDCPLLFTIAKRSLSGIQRLRFDQYRYELSLWCEHPGNWHPWSKATYSVDQPKEWLVRIGPYANLILKVLKLAVPLAGPVGDIVLNTEQIQHAKGRLDLMTAVIAEIPAPAIQDHRHSEGLQTSSQLSPAEGEAARALRTLLFQHDPARSFGDLRRVLAPSGDLLWVCPDHYPEYDPGLPAVPKALS